jgi:hypothetical protein
MRFFRVLAFTAAGMAAGLATAALIVFTCNKLTEGQGVSELIFVGLFLLIALPLAGAIGGGLIAGRTRRKPPP